MHLQYHHMHHQYLNYSMTNLHQDLHKTQIPAQIHRHHHHYLYNKLFPMCLRSHMYLHRHHCHHIHHTHQQLQNHHTHLHSLLCYHHSHMHLHQYRHHHIHRIHQQQHLHHIHRHNQYL